jgi:leader peptidase (prepilin peptidase) / N-methyltransferase
METPGLILAGVVGACVGSYTATAALRQVRAQQSWRGRSSCDACGVRLSFARTAPVISFLQARGACADCGARIDPAHLAGELAGVGIAVSAVAAASMGRAIVLVVLGFALLAASLVDAKTRRLPDLLTAMVAASALVLRGLQGTDAVLEGVAAAIIAFVLLEALRRGFLALRGQPGLGLGDVKLLAALALWLGVATPWALVLAAVLGLVIAVARPSADGRIAFGPCLAGAGWLVGLYLEISFRSLG